MADLGDVDSRYALGFSVALDVCHASFYTDYENANRVHDLIFEPVERGTQAAWGNALAVQFVIWREDVPPTMPGFLVFTSN